VTGAAADWLTRFTDRPDAATRLVCFPHAGGGAPAFYHWAHLLPPDIDLAAVQYPGRLNRMGEPCLTEMDDMTAGICRALAQDGGGPLVLFGHSMGALVAYEVAGRLSSDGWHPVERLIVSAHPHPAATPRTSLHRAPDEALCAELRRLGGSDPSALQDDRLRPLVLALIRRDYQLVETYRHRARPKLACPVTGFAGDSDSEATPDQMRAWAEVTTAGFDLRVFPGGHFYLNPAREAVVAAVVEVLTAVCPDGRAPLCGGELA
jgi:pyochelin biosynthetic protein PchC